MTREKRGKVVCQRVAEKVREVTPPGLGRWDRLMEFVLEPDNRFFDALAVWLDHDNATTRADLQDAADNLVRAWRAAGRRFEAEGRPETRTEVPA